MLSARSLSLALALFAAPALAQDPPADVRAAPLITLADAMRVAFERNPELRAHLAEVDEARARLVTARTYPFNPEISFDAGHRRAGGGSSTDSSVELSQEIELGGQTSRRAAAARVEVEASEERLRHATQILAAHVELAFADALRATETAAVDEADLDLAESSLGVSRRRLEAGAATDLEVNLARAAQARAASRLQQSRAAAAVATYLLAEAMGVSPDDAPSPTPSEPDLSREPVSLSDLLALARERRADLAAFRALVRAADARIALARSERIPNLRVGLFHAREGGDETIDGGSVGIALPLFNRSRGAVAEATAGRVRAGAESESAERSVERDVAESWATYRAAREIVARLGGDLVGSLEESLELLRKSNDAGKIGIAEVLLFRRELLDGRRDYVSARADAWRARILLDLATGAMPVPDVISHEQESTP